MCLPSQYNQIHRRAADGIHWNPDAVRWGSIALKPFKCSDPWGLERGDLNETTCKADDPRLRMQLNIIMTHYCQSRRIPLPNRWMVGEKNPRNLLLEESNSICEQAFRDYRQKIELPRRPKQVPRKYAVAKRRHYQNNNNAEGCSSRAGPSQYSRNSKPRPFEDLLRHHRQGQQKRKCPW